MPSRCGGGFHLAPSCLTHAQTCMAPNGACQLSCCAALFGPTADPMKNLGYKTLGRCTKLIVSYFEANGPEDIADALRSENLISGEAYDEVCLRTITCGVKARTMLRALIAATKNNPESFFTFVEVIMDYNGKQLAQKLKTKYAERQANENIGTLFSRPSTSSSEDKDGDKFEALQERIMKMEGTFSELALKLLSDLKTKGTRVEELTSTISTLPLSINKYVYAMWNDVCRSIGNNESLDSLFTVLNMEVWNILDYHLLEYFIEKHGDLQLRKKMKAYVSELESFKGNVLVADFIECWGGPPNRDIPDYEKLSVKFDFDTHNLTLAKVDGFRKKLFKKFFPSLLNYAGWIFYKYFKTGSFVVAWLLSKEMALIIKNNISDMADIIQEYKITQVCINGTPILNRLSKHPSEGKSGGFSPMLKTVDQTLVCEAKDLSDDELPGNLGGPSEKTSHSHKTMKRDTGNVPDRSLAIAAILGVYERLHKFPLTFIGVSALLGALVVPVASVNSIGLLGIAIYATAGALVGAGTSFAMIYNYINVVNAVTSINSWPIIQFFTRLTRPRIRHTS